MPEVDLTEDKSYSNLTTMPRSATNVLPEIFRESSIPWNFSTPYTLPRIVHSDAELGQVPLVFTGDAETINFIREVAEVEEGKRCDCCGKLITTPLWDMDEARTATKAQVNAVFDYISKFNRYDMDVSKVMAD